jgi:dihydrolipoamide dehydrogenase
MNDYDVLVIGSGPGGYVSAIRCSQLGLRTGIVERDHIGGICLNWGCIPSKALLRNAEILSLFHRAHEFGISYSNLKVDFSVAIDRSRKVVNQLTGGVASLLKKNKITHIQGNASLTGTNSIQIKDSGETYEAKHLILATGASPKILPTIPIDGELVITSREALETVELPESILIIGGGATGCEFAYIYNSYGVKVTMVELLPQLLPNEDSDISQYLKRIFTKQGIEVRTGSKVVKFSKENGKAQIELESSSGKETLSFSKILIATGVEGNIKNIGLESLGIKTERGFIQINDEMQTNSSSVYAIGDVTGKMLLAHVASAQGVFVAEHIAGKDPAPLNYKLIPRAVYCQPQVASWGVSETQATELKLKFKVGRFPFSANGKALGLGEGEGFVKIIVGEEYGEILGAHLIGPEVTEILAELSLANLLEGTAKEVGLQIHAHPTLSEAIKEAALATEGEAIHI